MPNFKSIGQELRPVAWGQAKCDIRRRRRRRRRQADGIVLRRLRRLVQQERQ